MTGDVSESLRRRILTEQFHPGERLPVEEIAREMGVSVAQARTAIHRLAEEGLIEIRPRSGSYVSDLTINDIEETTAIRCSLESLAAESAVARITPAQLLRFEQLVNDLAAPVDTNEDRVRHEARNYELHRLLIESSGNRRLSELYDVLKSHMQVLRVLAVGKLDWRRRLPDEQVEHEEMLAALQSRDRERLVAVVRRHIERSKIAMIRALSGGSHGS